MDNCPYCGTALVNGNCPYQEQSIFRSDGVIGMVKVYANHTDDIWRTMDDHYWLERLMQEVGELASVIAHDHDDTVEHELLQIASIAVNWLRKIKPEWTSE